MGAPGYCSRFVLASTFDRPPFAGPCKAGIGSASSSNAVICDSVRLGEVASGRPRFGLPGEADPTPQNVAQQQPLRRAPGELALVFGASGLDGTPGHLHAQVTGARHGGRPEPSGPARRGAGPGPTASDRNGRRRFRRRQGQGGGGGTSTAHRAGSRMSASGRVAGCRRAPAPDSRSRTRSATPAIGAHCHGARCRRGGGP